MAATVPALIPPTAVLTAFSPAAVPSSDLLLPSSPASSAARAVIGQTTTANAAIEVKILFLISIIFSMIHCQIKFKRSIFVVPKMN
jgi:hypothetical protein